MASSLSAHQPLLCLGLHCLHHGHGHQVLHVRHPTTCTHGTSGAGGGKECQRPSLQRTINVKVETQGEHEAAIR